VAVRQKLGPFCNEKVQGKYHIEKSSSKQRYRKVKGGELIDRTKVGKH